MSVLVQETPFSVDQQQSLFLASSSGAGLVTFTGYLRDFSAEGGIEALELEHYPGMTERVLEELGAAAVAALTYEVGGLCTVMDELDSKTLSFGWEFLLIIAMRRSRAANLLWTR